MKNLCTFVAVAFVSTLAFSQASFAVRVKAKSAKPMTTASVDLKKSKIVWSGKKKLIQSVHTGEIKLSSGNLKFEGDRLKGGEFVVDMNTITNTDLKKGRGREKLIGHLKSDDFFSVGTYKTAKFKITNVKKKSEGMYTLTGDLTVKKETKPVSFDAEIKEKAGVFTGKGVLTFDRTKFGLIYGSDNFFKNLGDKVIHNEIKLDLTLIAKMPAKKEMMKKSSY